VMHLDRGAFFGDSALCFKPGRTEVHEKGPLQRNRLPRAALKFLALLFKLAGQIAVHRPSDRQCKHVPELTSGETQCSDCLPAFR
jgi:hypothetical protein